MRAKVYLILFLLLTVLAGTAYLCSETMRISEVVVLGCVEQDPAKVAELAQITGDLSVFKLKMKEVSARVESDPYFDVDSVRYIFPDKLRITVKEHLASAYIPLGGSMCILDEDSMVLEKVLTLGDRVLPIAQGVAPPFDPEVGKKLDTAFPEEMVDVASRQCAALSAVLTQLRAQDALSMISQINVTEVSDITMETVAGFSVSLGNFDEMENKIRWYKGVEPILLSEGYTGGVITVSTGNSASFLPTDTKSKAPEEPEE